MLKEVCHEIFDLQFFFYDSNIYGPLINRLNSIFEVGFDFVEIFDHKVLSALCSVQHTTENISAVC